MEQPIEEIIIRSENQAFSLLKKALENEISDTTQIVFEGWPIFNLTIKGTDFNGSIPTRIMPPILDLQKEIYRIYCGARYNSHDTKKLTVEERRLLELVVTIKPGSTEFITELFKAFNEIIKNSNMSSKQILILLVAIAIIISSNLAWKDWLSAKEREHSHQITVKLSEQETERMGLVTQALTKSAELRNSKQALSEFKDTLALKLKPTDEININQEPIINGTVAAEIVRPKKEMPKEVRLDGTYIINEVKFPAKFGGDYRFSVTRLIDNKSFMVDAAPDLLAEDEINILKESGFGVKRVDMKINAKEHRGDISSAKIISIEWTGKSH